VYCRLSYPTWSPSIFGGRLRRGACGGSTARPVMIGIGSGGGPGSGGGGSGSGGDQPPQTLQAAALTTRQLPWLIFIACGTASPGSPFESAERLTPELRAKYDALLATSTPVEPWAKPATKLPSSNARTRAPALASRWAKFNHQDVWLNIKTSPELETILRIAWREARLGLQLTMKMLRVRNGKAKEELREEKLKGKRTRKKAKEAEEAGIAAVVLKRKYSELKSLGINELRD